MAPDKYQQAWQEQSSQTRVTVDADLLLQEAQRHQRDFRTVIAWQDYGHIVVSLLTVPMWIAVGVAKALPWTWYLMVPVYFWSVGFTLVFRARRKRPPEDPDQPLVSCVKELLASVEHQIWMQRNIYWLSVLPTFVVTQAFMTHVSFLSGDWPDSLIASAGTLVFLSALFCFMYYTNKRHTAAKYEPQRQELLALLARFRDDAAGDEAENPAPASVSPFSEMRRMTPCLSPARVAVSWLLVFAILLAILLLALVSNGGAPSLLGAVVDSPREPEFHDVSAFAEDDVSRVDAWLEEQVDLAKYPSLNIAIVRDGYIVYQRAFGFEDVKARRKATPQTAYHVASVTKAFTAALAVMLHDRGVVDLDQPVVKYLPKHVSISTTPEVGATMTLRQLASHTSGLPRGVPGTVQSVEGWYQLEPNRLYEHLSDVTLEFDPGTDEEYSNLGFGLLGHALECAADKPFDRLLREMICDPLQLKKTAIQVNDKLLPATGYGGSGWRFERKHSFRERLAASGGLVASVEDLAKFLAAQMEPGVFSSEMLKQLHTESILSDGSTARRALGWSVRSSDSIGRILQKNGGRSNCSAWIGFAPEHGVGVAVATNCGGPDVDAIGYWLLERSVPGAHVSPVTKYGYAKVAPYTGVRWKNDRPIVRVQDRWSPLVSIDGIPIERIMEFARKEYADKARKRFAEDLVEVLSKMGHEPKWTVTLGLETQDGHVEQAQILMTEQNRALVREENVR